MFSRLTKSLSIVTIVLFITAATAQPPPAPGGQPARGARGGGFGPPAAAADDAAGFEAIFDGKTLNHWDGEPGLWRVEDGTIVGETTAEKAIKQNTFLIWRGGAVRDFELKLEFRLTASANSGVQYRSTIVSDVSKWAMKGYQADMDGANNYTGMLYEERGRGFLAPRGTFNRMAEGKVSKRIASVGEADALKAFIKTGGEWNQIHIIAKGGTLIHVINGHVTAVFIDEDSANRAFEGLLGLQLHVGQPMKNEFRNILYKKL